VFAILGEIIALGSAFAFGISNVFFRKVEGIYPPLVINLTRTSLGTIIFLILIIINNNESEIYFILNNLTILFLLIISGLFGQAIGDTIYYYSQKYVGVSIALPISLSFPIWTSLYALILLNQYLTLNSALALFLILIGILIFSRNNNRNSINLIENEKGNLSSKDNDNKNLGIIYLGIILAIISANSWALGAISADLAFNEFMYDTNVGNVIRFFPAILFMLILIPLTNSNVNMRDKGSKSIFKISNITYLMLGSIIGTVVGAFLYLEGINLLGSAKASIFYSTSPLFATPLAVLFLGEKLSKKIILGTFFMILGIWILFL
jgi:DME family drug/metabolite transporter